jgi:hypothetical protein
MRKLDKITLLIFCIVFWSCSKEESTSTSPVVTPPTTNNPYIVGTRGNNVAGTGEQAIVWNRTLTGIEGGVMVASNRSIRLLSANHNLLRNTDRFVVGACDTLVNGTPTGIPKPYIMENETCTILSKSGVAKSLFVSGKDVYVLGHKAGVNGADSDRIWGFWKNKVWNPLPLIPHSIFVSNSDVYIVGSFNIGTGQVFFVPAIWKNGTITRLSTSNGVAKSVFVTGSDVYICGDLFNTSGLFPAMWKNGIISNLSTVTNHPNGATINIIASNNNIYVSGYRSSGNGGEYGYWKNGVWSGVPNCKQIRSFIVNGNDIYLGGTVEVNRIQYEGYIKNGEVIRSSNVWYGALTSMSIN